MFAPRPRIATALVTLASSYWTRSRPKHFQRFPHDYSAAAATAAKAEAATIVADSDSAGVYNNASVVVAANKIAVAAANTTAAADAAADAVEAVAVATVAVAAAPSRRPSGASDIASTCLFVAATTCRYLAPLLGECCRGGPVSLALDCYLDLHLPRLCSQVTLGPSRRVAPPHRARQSTPWRHGRTLAADESIPEGLSGMNAMTKIDEDCAC